MFDYKIIYICISTCIAIALYTSQNPFPLSSIALFLPEVPPPLPQSLLDNVPVAILSWAVSRFDVLPLTGGHPSK